MCRTRGVCNLPAFVGKFEGHVARIAQHVTVQTRPIDDVQVLGVLNAFPAVPEPGAKCCPAASGGVQYHVHIVLGAGVRGVRSRVPRKGVPLVHPGEDRRRDASAAR